MQAATVLPFHFLVIAILGVRCPIHWSPPKKSLYNLYTLLVIAVMFSLVGLQLARIAFIKLSLDELIETLYVTIATAAACFKLVCFVAHRDQVSQLIGMFQIEQCLGRDDYEISLKRRYDRICRKIGKTLLLFVETEVLLFVLAPLTERIETRKLPYEAFQIYDMSNPVIYGLTYVHHAYAGILYGGVGIISDAIIGGFMLELCAQLDVMSHRLNNFPAQARLMYKFHNNAAIIETYLLKANIQHHLHIYNIARVIMVTFNDIIVAQFYASTLQICLSVYQLSFKVSNVVELINHGFFLICMLSTLGIYCYFGNELTIKSVDLRDEIYNIDWTSLTTVTKRNLTFMICRASKPIEFHKGAFVRLTMQTFASVVKLSYSAFSVITSSR